MKLLTIALLGLALISPLARAESVAKYTCGPYTLYLCGAQNAALLQGGQVVGEWDSEESTPFSLDGGLNFRGNHRCRYKGTRINPNPRFF